VGHALRTCTARVNALCRVASILHVFIGEKRIHKLFGVYTSVYIRYFLIGHYCLHFMGTLLFHTKLPHVNVIIDLKNVLSFSTFGFEFRFPISVSNFGFQFRYRISVSNFGFQFRFPISLSNFDFQFRY
jgi:hypothetical protein